MTWEVHYPSESELEASLPENIGQMLIDCVARTPQKPALVFFDHDERLTYTELSEQVRRVAASFQKVGIRKGTHVGLIMPNRLEFPVTWLALAWIGAVSVQLNPRYKTSELAYALNDADVDFLIIDETSLTAFEAIEPRPNRLADDNIFVTGMSRAYTHWSVLLEAEPLPEEPPEGITQHDSAACLYTSGTTGFPKGCILGHRYWLQLASLVLFCQGGHHPNNVLIYEPMFYMQGNGILLGALCANATVYCSARSSIKQFLDWVQKYQIDYCAYPAPAVAGIEEQPKEKGQTLKWVHTWYYHGDQLERLEKHFDVVGRDIYGMTENGVCLFVPVNRPDLVAAGAMGVLTPWRQARIVGEDGNDLLDGEVGELWTAGPGHMHGYYRKPDANKSSFVGNWFRTGDLMRRDASGAYYLIGRIKDMVKRSGENISAAELEDCLCKLRGVLMAAIVPVPDADKGEEIKAYLQLEEGLSRLELPPSLVLAHCAEHLATFKTPRYLAYLETFPLTAGNDKVSKPQLIAGVSDLRLGAYDRVDDVWR